MVRGTSSDAGRRLTPRVDGNMTDEPEWVDPGPPEAMLAEVVARFTAAYGRGPESVAAAPGRVNLMGEHTDYNGGLCLPIAIPHSTWVAAAVRDDAVLGLASTQQDETIRVALADLRPGAVTGWAAYAAGVAWAARDAGMAVRGMDVMVHGSVPLGAGLSSSASLECAMALAVCDVAGVPVDDALRRRLVEVCGRAEREMAGAPTGGMDQTASLLARPGHALLLDCRDGSVEHVPWDPSGAGVELVVVDTRAAHALSDGAYGSRREECQAAAARLGVPLLRDADDAALASTSLPPVLARRARHVVSEIDRVRQAVAAIRADDLPALGGVFDRSHASLRDDFEVSCPELDAVCEAAGRAGALGARMTGGGFGGSAIVLAPRDRVGAIRAEIEDAFAGRGWPGPGFLRAEASGGAHGVRP